MRHAKGAVRNFIKRVMQPHRKMRRRRERPYRQPKAPSVVHYVYHMPANPSELKAMVQKCLMCQFSVRQGAKTLKVQREL